MSIVLSTFRCYYSVDFFFYSSQYEKFGNDLEQVKCKAFHKKKNTRGTNARTKRRRNKRKRK